ncbi:MAG: TIGR03915 family putative DNA repair protein [Lachnospiraceae bacterium]|nr:TIGR03915 family putative DNA repair protein [Lachnospiraceae bacterium]
MTVFTCNDDFESMMTCIYEAWASRLGHQNVRLEKEPIIQPNLFCEYVHVDGDAHKTEMVVRSIQKKISYEAYVHMFYACLSNATDALDTIYRFLIRGFAYGGKVMSMLSDQTVIRMMELRRNVGSEAHYFREFSRFTSIGGNVYVCHFEPKNNVLMPVAEHFKDRMPSEHWIMVDDNRRIAAIHPKDEDFYIRYLTPEEAETLAETEKVEDEYTRLWRTFFHTIGIEQRKNPACQRNMFPIWMRKHATEFMDEKNQ